MLSCRNLRRLGVVVAFKAVLVGAVGVGAQVVPTDVALAQSDEECYEQVEVITGETEDGDPLYGVEWVNTCEDPGGGTGSSSGPNTCRHEEFGELPCSDPVRGWWSSSEQCYVSSYDPQPPAGDPLWEGNDPEDGAIYLFYCPAGAGTFSEETGFLAEAPSLPSVAQLAQQAMESLPLVGADIGIAPNPDGAGLVGLPVWMWTNDTSATWGPVSVSVSVPGLTVTAEANATEITWDMGDGEVVVCDGPGTPYDPSYEGEESPDCGHVYTEPSRSQPGGKYEVIATTEWHAEWWVEGGGASGEQFFLRDSSTSVQINELQVVTS